MKPTFRGRFFFFLEMLSGLNLRYQGGKTMIWLLFGSIWSIEVVVVLPLAAFLDVANRRQQTSV